MSNTSAYNVSAYAFNCGAKVQDTNNGFKVSMHREGGVYHVSVYNTVDKVWVKAKCFHTIKEARQRFSNYVRISKI
jgi:hypothetical protein